VHFTTHDDFTASLAHCTWISIFTPGSSTEAWFNSPTWTSIHYSSSEFLLHHTSQHTLFLQFFILIHYSSSAAPPSLPAPLLLRRRLSTLPARPHGRWDGDGGALFLPGGVVAS
jgi:hypothetical protein